MSWRFHRSFKIAPGIHLNIGKKSGSISFGPRGAKLTVGTRGTHVTAGIPGTGLYNTEKIGSSGSQARHMTVCPYCGHRMRKHWACCPQCGHPLAAAPTAAPAGNQQASFAGCVFIVAVVLVIFFLFL